MEDKLGILKENNDVLSIREMSDFDNQITYQLDNTTSQVVGGDYDPKDETV